MSDGAANLKKKIGGAEDLHAVVRTMKALAASSIGQYEKSVLALTDYSKTIELGLQVCLRENASLLVKAQDAPREDRGEIGAIVFGSDQGLVGQFNDIVVDFAIKTLADYAGKLKVYAIGQRVQLRLLEKGIQVVEVLSVPTSVDAITPLVARIQIDAESHFADALRSSVYIFHNRPLAGSLYQPILTHLLPLDAEWGRNLQKAKWTTGNLPQLEGNTETTLRALIREYLFVSIFRACAESLSSENASRLAAMERADKSIDDLLKSLQGKYNRLRQGSIDEELFDVVSGFEALRVSTTS